MRPISLVIRENTDGKTVYIQENVEIILPRIGEKILLENKPRKITDIL